MIAVIVIAALVLIAVVLYALQMRRRSHLRQQFGPEYNRTVEEIGGKRRADQELMARERRVQSLRIRALTVQERDRFVRSWRNVQARFVDAPVDAVHEADRLVVEVLEARGYPVGDFEQRAADISVDHPLVVENYRAARDLAERSRHGTASTEDLRKAMVHYRQLFEDLLEVREADREVKVEKAS
jgi:hypothetical protein